MKPPEERNQTSGRELLALVFRYVKPHRVLLFFGITVIPLSIACATAQPWLLSYIIDDVLLQNRSREIGFYVLALLGIVLTGYAADSVYTYSLQRVGQHAIYDMRRAAFRRCLKFPRSYFDVTPAGVVLTRLTSDFEAMGESIASGVLTILIDLLKTAFLLALLFYMSWELALLLIAVSVPCFFFSSYMHRRLKYYYQLSRSALAVATGYLHECLAGMKTVQLYSAEKQIHREYSAKHTEFLNAQKSTNAFEVFLFSFIDGFTILTIGVVLWGGIRFALEGSLTVGVLIAFLNTLQKIFVPIREFAQQNAAIQRSLAAVRSIDTLFRQKTEEESEKDSLAKAEFQSLVFNGVSFRYGEDQPYVLSGISFSLRAGERLAFVGATGSGKSTVIRLLGKQYTGYEGSILLNGCELSEYTRAEVQGLLAVMHQDTFLFEDTVRFNIRLERDFVTENAMLESARYVQADTFIEKLPGKYGHILKGQGGNLSSGQSQLINFSRVLAGNPMLIVLDEATSSVDSITENLIEQAIEKIFKEKTVIAVAHRLSTVSNSDLILVMKNGNIVERGNHDELLGRFGYYHELFHQKTLDTGS